MSEEFQIRRRRDELRGRKKIFKRIPDKATPVSNASSTSKGSLLSWRFPSAFFLLVFRRRVRTVFMYPSVGAGSILSGPRSRRIRWQRYTKTTTKMASRQNENKDGISLRRRGRVTHISLSSFSLSVSQFPFTLVFSAHFLRYVIRRKWHGAFSAGVSWVVLARRDEVLEASSTWHSTSFWLRFVEKQGFLRSGGREVGGGCCFSLPSSV